MLVHAMGVLTTLLAIIFLKPVYTAIARNGYSVSSDMYHMLVYTNCTAFWWKGIAERTS